MYFVSLLAKKVFFQHMLRCILCDTFSGLAGMGGVCLPQVEKHFVSSQAWDGFGQHKLRAILSPGWHWMTKVNTCDESCVLAGMGGGLFSQAWEELVNTC